MRCIRVSIFEATLQKSVYRAAHVLFQWYLEKAASNCSFFSICRGNRLYHFSRCNIFEILQLWFYLLCLWFWVQSLARTAGDPSTFLICTNNLKNLPTFGNLSRIIQTKPTVLPDLFRVIVTYVSCSLGLRSPPTLRHTC